MLPALFVMQGMNQLSGAYAQSQAYKMQGDFQRHMFEFNQRVAKMQAEDALKRGDDSASQHRSQVRQLIGDQRAAMAAQGIEVDTGSAADVQASTQMMGEMDAIRIKNNAWREAWGYRMEALSQGSQGQFAHTASRMAAQSTILSGGMQAMTSGMRAYHQWGK